MTTQYDQEATTSAQIPPLRLSNDIRQLWTLRALVPLKGWKWLLDDADIYASEGVARLAGLPPLVGPDIDPTLTARREHLVRSWRRAEARTQRYRLRRPFDRNMAALRSLLGLNAVESQVLALAITAAFDPMFSDLCENFAPLSQHGARVWSGILSLPSDRIRKAFLPQGKLAVSQILDELSPVWNAASELQVKTPELSSVYSDPHWSPEQLISGFARPLPDAELAPGDFPHHADDIALMVSYLRTAVARRRKGVNILLHGVPGVGKTQLSRIVARSINAQAYEVATAVADGDPANAQRRLCMFASCQRVLADDRKLLVFDEVDHALNDCGMLSDGQTTAERVKGWLNDHLESNPVPTIWIANSIWHLNPALARRFDIIMEVKVPPTAQRVAMIQAEAKGLLDADSSRRLAGVSSLNPATLRRAARVVASVKASPEVSAQRLERLIDRSLRAQHLGGLPSRDTLGGALEFDPSLVNAPVDLAELAAGLIHHPHARLLLHGPPGTGKTAFGRWLATQLDQPCVVKKASDLLGPFVGQTERLIARAFEEARDCKAILQIDEVENFLRARDQAKARWEASLVNEFLVQLESFPGVFVATTNLLGELDTAALRRFDAKIGFEWLQPDQAMRCLTQVLAQLELPVDVPETTAMRLRGLGTVTPGDFAAIARRHRFQPISGADAFVAALEEESQLKRVGPPRRVGFV